MDNPQSTTRHASSASVRLKAHRLAPHVRYVGNARLDVPGLRGITYRVRADTQVPGKVAPVDRWTCTCRWAQHGGRQCSHIRAAYLWARDNYARLQQQRARNEVAA